MRKPLLVLSLFATCTAFTLSASAGCNLPEDPEIPNGKTASEEVFIKAKEAVEAYMEKGEAYIECTTSTRMHNAMVQRMELTAKKFNRQLRHFKARG